MNAQRTLRGTIENTGAAVFSVTSSCATLTTVGEQAWDWSQHVVDHVEVHAADFGASVRFYAIVLAPLAVSSWSEDSESERVMCFTRVNIVDRQPPTTGLHLCFVAASPEQAFSIRTTTTSRRSTATSVIRDTCRRGTVPRGSGDIREHRPARVLKPGRLRYFE